jgi:tetratricopeptide (TPR) repeat protein
MNNIDHFKIKKSARKFSWMLCGLVILLSIFNYPAPIYGAEFGDNELIKSLTARIGLNPADNDARWELARAYYDLAGFRDYYQVKSCLWTENTFRKTALNSKLPPVLPQAAQCCRQQLLAILDRNPGDGLALTMAGDYQYFYNQKEIALWYYRRAVELNPDSKAALLALADYYLSEWQPAKVLELLSKSGGSDFTLRKGIAWIQLSEYQLALGYLLQADSLPSWLQTTRDLNLFKVYLALGDYGRAHDFPVAHFPGAVPATLLKEIQGWNAFLADDLKEAGRIWNEGLEMNPDYYFWRGNQLGKGNATPPNGAQMGAVDFKRNNFFQAVAWILQGQIYGNDDPESAYRAFLAGIKADHLSLIGFLAAGRISFQEQEYRKALDLLNQGLAVNSKFGPLLSLRADVYQKLGRIKEANQDREAARLCINAGPDATNRLSFTPAWKVMHKSATESINMVIQGKTQDLIGFWVSGEKSGWDWIPYWGGPVLIPGRLKHGWWLPVGPGLSGQAYYLDNLTPEAFRKAIDPPRVTDDGRFMKFKFPVPVKLVVRIDHADSTKASFVSEQFEPDHAASIELFSPGAQTLDCWFQAMNGTWNRVFFNVTLPGDRNRGVPKNGANAGNQPDNPMTAALPPQLTSVLVVDALPDGYKIVWNADQAVSSYLQILSDRGGWDEIPITNDPMGGFTGWVPKAAVFCRIGLKSAEGGTVIYYPVLELNRRLAQNQSCRFTINDGSLLVNSRDISIKLEADHGFPPDNPTTGTSPEFQWSVSNDQRVWSPWHQGSKVCQWRLNSSEGAQLVYIRYKPAGDPAPAKITVIPIVLDMAPPEPDAVNWRLQETPGSQTKTLIIHLKFNEPVLLKTFIPETVKIYTGTDGYSNDLHSEFTVELPIGESPIIFALTARDRAGNENHFSWEAGGAGLYRTSDAEAKNR